MALGKSDGMPIERLCASHSATGEGNRACIPGERMAE